MGAVDIEASQGTFCRRELATPDPSGAGAFYSAVMGWEVRNGGGLDGTTALAMCRGHEVATLRWPRPDLGESAGEASWLSFISVPSVAESTRRVRLLGGEVLMPRLDVPGCRQAAIIADPSGARVALCRLEQDAEPAALSGSVGSYRWTELATRDAQRAAVFYAQLLGWKARVMMLDGTPSTLFLAEDTPVAGLLQLDGAPPLPPSDWRVCFEVASADEASARAETLGGRTAAAPTDLFGVGRVATMADPQGAPFTILEPLGE